MWKYIKKKNEWGCKMSKMDSSQQGACPKMSWRGRMCLWISPIMEMHLQPLPRAGCQFSQWIFHKFSDYSSLQREEMNCWYTIQCVLNPFFPLTTKAPQKWKLYLVLDLKIPTCILHFSTYSVAYLCFFSYKYFKWFN